MIEFLLKKFFEFFGKGLEYLLSAFIINNDMEKKDVILIEPKPLDWIKGRETGVTAIRTVLDWSKYLPDGEPQSTPTGDSDECATFSGPEHCIETQVNYDIAEGNYSAEALAYFESAGYMVNGKFKTSAIFNAKMNGTDQTGNYMNTVAESVRLCGLLPDKDLPFPSKFTWTAFNALEITQAQKAKALESLKYILINYQWISEVVNSQILSLAPVQIATGVCSGWNTDPVVMACSAPIEHCTMHYGLDNYSNKLIRDTYPAYDKVLSNGYQVYAAMQYIVTPLGQPLVVAKPNHLFNEEVKEFSTNVAEVTAIQTLLAWDLGPTVFDPKYICGSFGPRTLAAINAFQLKYENDILVPDQLSNPTGFWGANCCKKANELLAA